MDVDLIETFLTDLEQRRGISARSRNMRLSALRSFFRFALYYEPAHGGRIQQILAIPAKRHDRTLVGFLTRSEVGALHSASCENGEGAYGVDERARAEQFGISLSYLLCDQGTKAHELTLWTKHECRLNRDFGCKRFGDGGYAFEELVAELGAAFLCAAIDITPEVREDHAAYLGHWLRVLKDDRRAIFNAVDYLHGLQGKRAPLA